MTFKKMTEEEMMAELIAKSLAQGRPKDDPIEEEPLTEEERAALRMILGDYESTPEKSARELYHELFDFTGNPKLNTPVMDVLCRKHMLERGTVTETITWGNTRETETRNAPRIVVRLTPKAMKALAN